MSSRALRSLCIVLVIGVIFAIFVPQTLTAGSPAKKADPLFQQGDKNLQVLKDLPEGHREKIMDFVAASLGVKCNHCHVIDSTGWHMDLDDKPAKHTARKMMQMVMDINAKTFGGRNEVTCYTCHRGSTEPASVLPLPLPAQAPPQREESAEAPSLPSVDQVLAMTEKSLGGEDAMKKITTRVAKGVMVSGDGREMPMEVVFQSPDKFMSATTMKDGAQNMRGYNGKSGWMSSQRGTREMSPSQSEDMKASIAMFPMTRLRQLAKTMHVSRKDSIDGSEVYVLVAPGGERVTERYSIDTKSGLLLRKVVLTETMLANIPEQTDYSDYRDVNGVKVPFMIRSSSADARSSATRKFTSIEQNVPVDAKKFEMPAGGKK